MKKDDLVTYVRPAIPYKDVENYKAREELVVCKDVAPGDEFVMVRPKGDEEGDGVPVRIGYLEQMAGGLEG